MSRSRRIYYISPNRGALGYWRCTLPAYHLHKAGLAETAIDFGRFQKEFVDWADIVVVQRMLGNSIKHVVHYSHMKGKKVVFDLDDNVWCFPNSPEYQSKQAKEVPRLTTDILSRCDAATVSTQRIADAVREHAGVPTFVLPNYLDFSQWRRINIRHEHFLVGWMGGHYHVQDLEMIVPSLKEVISKNLDVTLVFLGCCPMRLFLEHPDRVFLQEFVNIELLPKTMAVMRFDIGLAPLYHSEFAMSRSNLRLLQYSALQIPSVASCWGEYARLADEGFPCVTVENGEWAEAVQELIDNREKRVWLGQEAYRYVKARYEIKDNIYKWKEVYDNL